MSHLEFTWMIIGISVAMTLFGILLGWFFGRRNLEPMADMLKALSKVETAVGASDLDEGQAEFFKASRRFSDRQPPGFSGSPLGRYDLDAWEQYIYRRSREIRDEQYKDIAQQHYDQMVKGDKTTEQLATLSVSLKLWMEAGHFRLNDFGHSHNNFAMFVAECGREAMLDPGPPTQDPAGQSETTARRFPEIGYL